MNAPHPEPDQFLLDAPDFGAIPTRESEPSWEMRAWAARKRRERLGLPMTRADREQITRQLEDL